MKNKKKPEPVLPFELDEPIAKLIAKHTPFPADVALQLLQDNHSVDAVLHGLHFALLYVEHPTEGIRRAKAIMRMKDAAKEFKAEAWKP